MLDKAANVAAKKMDRVAEIRADVQAMENRCKKTQFAVHKVHKLEAAGGGGCSSCDTVAPAAGDESAFEALGAQVLGKIASIRTLILEAAGRDALDGVEQGVRAWVASHRDYLDKFAKNNFGAAHEVITNRMLPVLASVDPSTGLLSNEERTFFSRSNAEAEGEGTSQPMGRAGTKCVGGVIVTGILSGGWRTSSGLRHWAADRGE